MVIHLSLLFLMKNNLTQSLGTQFLSSKGLSGFFCHSFSPNSLRKGKVDKPMLNATRTTNKLVAHFFSAINSLASKPVFTFKHHSVIVHVFYYIPVAGM